MEPKNRLFRGVNKATVCFFYNCKDIITFWRNFNAEEVCPHCSLILHFSIFYITIIILKYNLVRWQLILHSIKGDAHHITCVFHIFASTIDSYTPCRHRALQWFRQTICRDHSEGWPPEQNIFFWWISSTCRITVPEVECNEPRCL